MHDMWFAAKIVALLKEKKSEGIEPRRITVNIILSPFTHVTGKSLLSAFGMLGTPEGVSDATLNIKTGEILIRCDKCGKNTKITAPVSACPVCGSGSFQIQNPDEFLIDSIEIK